MYPVWKGLRNIAGASELRHIPRISISTLQLRELRYFVEYAIHVVHRIILLLVLFFI